MATQRLLGWLFVVSIVLIASCRPVPPESGDEPLRIVPASEWPQLVDDLDRRSFAAACSESFSHLAARSPELRYTFGSVDRSAAELAEGVRRSCEIVLAHDDSGARTRALAGEFLLLESVGRDGGGEILYTGYYEPLLDARRQPESGFEHPVYEVPDDLITVDLEPFGVTGPPSKLVGRVDQRRLVPYPSREDIDFAAAISGRAMVLGYVADLVDVFFMHVQGSGTLLYPDGERLRAGYAATNGRPYRSIGRLLLDEGVVSHDDMSMQAIRGYLASHPRELRRILAHNPSYVFFRPLDAGGGPLGCYEVPLTAGRSIATDRSLFPAPVVAWIQGTVPAADGGDVDISRFVLNQDTGGSIRGPDRLDLFFGAGDGAGELAGRTKHLGKMYFLLPKDGEKGRG